MDGSDSTPIGHSLPDILRKPGSRGLGRIGIENRFCLEFGLRLGSRPRVLNGLVKYVYRLHTRNSEFQGCRLDVRIGGDYALSPDASLAISAFIGINE